MSAVFPVYRCLSARKPETAECTKVAERKLQAYTFYKHTLTDSGGGAMRLPWIASSRTDKQVAGDFLVPSFLKKWSSLTRSHNISADRFLIKYDDAFRMRNLKETSIEGFGPVSGEKIHREFYIYISRLDSSRIAPPISSRLRPF